MSPHTKHVYIAVLSAGLLVALAIVLSAYVSSGKNVAQAHQVEQDMKPVHQEQAERKEQATSAEATNQHELVAALAAIAAAKSQPVQTPVDYDRIAQMIQARMGATAEVKADPQQPGAPTATLPAKTLRDYMLGCDATEAKLSACGATAQNLSTQVDAEKRDHDATKLELAAAKKAMNGGGFWARVKGNSKWFAIGGAAGAAVVAGVKHGQAQSLKSIH